MGFADSGPTLPSNTDVERALLGAMLLDHSVSQRVDGLRPDDFSLDSHRTIYRHAREMLDAGEPVDVLTLAEKLRHSGKLEQIGGVAYLSDLTSCVVVGSVERQAEALKQTASLRKLARIGDFLQQQAAQPNADPLILATRFRSALDSLAGRSSRRLRAVTPAEFLALEVRPREMILEPIIPAQGLSMIYSKRGTGKTYLALGIAHAVATGGTFLKWTASKPRRVLYVDGELPAAALQERLAAVLGGNAPACDGLRLITSDLQNGSIPDLATNEGQALIEGTLDGAELLILDNLSALVRSGKENEGESWLPVQEWALRLRQKGVSVLFEHHAGKGGTQRGTSRREDLLDVVIALRHPSDYSPADGLRCVVEFEKIRHFCGEPAKPFEVRMEIRDGGAVWSMKDVEDAQLQRAAELFRDGISVTDLSEEMGISRAKAGRLRVKAKAAGLL